MIANTSNLFDFPTEILGMIFSELSPKDVLSTLSTHQKFRNISEKTSLIADACFNNHDHSFTLKEAESLIRKCAPSITRINLSNINCCSPIDKICTCLTQILTSCNKLKTIEFHGTCKGLYSFTPEMQIKALYLENCKDLSDQLLLNALSSCSNLEILGLRSSTKLLGDEKFIQTISKCKTLKVLDLSVSKNHKNNKFFQIQINPNLISNLKQHRPDLKVLGNYFKIPANDSLRQSLVNNNFSEFLRIHK